MSLGCWLCAYVSKKPSIHLPSQVWRSSHYYYTIVVLCWWQMVLSIMSATPSGIISRGEIKKIRQMTQNSGNLHNSDFLTRIDSSARSGCIMSMSSTFGACRSWRHLLLSIIQRNWAPHAFPMFSPCMKRGTHKSLLNWTGRFYTGDWTTIIL